MSNKLTKAFIATIMKQLKIDKDPFAESLIKKLLGPVKPIEYEEFFEMIFERSDFIALDRVKRVSDTFKFRRNAELRARYQHGEKVFGIIYDLKMISSRCYAEALDDTTKLKGLKIKDFDLTDEDIININALGGISHIAGNYGLKPNFLIKYGTGKEKYLQCASYDERGWG